MTSLRILIIDDEPAVLDALNVILQAYGHLPTVASGGQSGLDIFQTMLSNGVPFDVVITDLSMPYVDGQMVAASIKAQSPATPIILLTGWDSRIEVTRTISSYVDRILGKPPHLNELRDALIMVTARQNT